MAKLYFKVASDWEEVVKLRNEIAKLKQELKGMDSTQSPAAFKTLNTQLSASTQKMDELVTNAAKAGAVMEGDFKKKIFDASQTVNGFTERIIAQKAVVKDVEADVKRLGDAYRTALKNNPLSANGKLAEYNSARKALDEEKAALFGLTQEQANARLSVKKLRDEYELYNNDGKEVVATNEGIAISWKKALAVIGGVGALKALGTEIIRVRGEFQSMQTAMETMVGKDVAGPLMAQVKELAKISPLTMTDMVGAEKMMLGFNIQAEDTIKYLKALSDISMGESSKFNSLTLAFSQMSAAGKLMGQDLNQMINAGFNPLQTMSEKTGKSIATLKDEMSKGAISAEMVQQAFLDATSAGGKFYNMSENASKTINGQLSMMQDALDNIFNEIGTRGEGVIMSGVQATTSLIQNYETIGKILAGLIVTYGVYKTAVITNIVLTQSWAAAAKADAVAKGIQTVATKAQIIATGALNAVMKLTPWGLALTGATAIAAALWAFHDSSTEAEKAQKRFNERQEEASKAEQEHKQKIDSLISALESETTSTLSRSKAFADLRKEYPKIFEKYDVEKLKLQDILRIKKEIAEIDSQRAFQANKSDYVSLLNKRDMIDKELAFRSVNYGNGQYKYPDFQEKSITDLRKERRDLNSELSMMADDLREKFNAIWNTSPREVKVISLQKNIQSLKDERNKLETLVSPNYVSRDNDAYNPVKEIVSAENIARLKVVNDLIKEQTGELDKLTKKEDSKGIQNKTFWEKLKKEAEAARNALDVSEKNSKEWNKYTKQIQEAQKQIDKYSDSKSSKEEKSVVKRQNVIVSQNEKIAELERKQGIERQRQREDLENRLVQSRIDVMTDGFKKKQAQVKLDNKKEIQILERQKEDYIREVIRMEKEKFDALEDLKAKRDPKYKKSTFNSSFVSVDTSAFDAMTTNITTRQLKDKIREQEDTWNEYLIKFGGYQQKRKALIEKYNKEIAESKTAGDAAIHEKEKANAIDELDNSVKNSATLMGQLFADASRKSVNEIQKIIEKAELLMQYLGTVKDEQGNAQIGGKGVSKKDILNLGISDNTLQNLEISTEEVEALRSAIDRLKGDLGGKSPFKLFETQIKSAVKKISQGSKKNIAQGITEIGTSITSFAPAISQLGKDFGNIFGDDELGNKISGLTDSLGGLGQTATGIGQIMSGDIVGGAMSAVSGISSIVSALDGLFGANYDKYNKAKEEYESYVSVLDDVIEKQKEMVASLDTQNAVNTYDYAKSLIEKSAETARILGKERLNAGASAGSHSIGVRIRKGMSSDGWSEAEKALGAVFENATEGRMTGLFDLSVEQLEKLQTEAPTFWAKLDDDVRTYLEDIISANESAEDLKDTLNESLTGISFDSLFDNFLESLYDIESSAEDISDDIADYLRKSLIKSLAVENYRGKMKEWYERWVEAMKDGKITAEEQESLDNLKNSIITGATESAKLINDQFEYLNKDSSQSSTSKGYQTMSQDTGEELSGRFTALQIAGEEIKNQNAIQSQSLNLLTMKADDLLHVNTDMRNIADDTRNLIADSYLELVQISENTGNSAKYLKEIKADIAEVKKNTSKL